jgi:hypothetical protein
MAASGQSTVEECWNVRITVDLDEDLLHAVEERRTACKTTGQVLADLARQALGTSPAPDFTAVTSSRDVLREDDKGVPTLTRTWLD